MKELAEIEFLKIKEEPFYAELIEKVIKTCFQEESLEERNIYVSITLTTPSVIRKRNKQYRNIDKETDVLSFPMFEKQEIEQIGKEEYEEVLGDIVISIEKVKEQAVEYGHSIERELAYMVVHGFYHLMGYDHMEENQKEQMREKEEVVLKKLKITRNG